MEKIGYGILISIYLISFSIGKGILNSSDMSMFESNSNQNIIQSIADDIANVIGMNDFFDSLNKGL